MEASHYLVGKQDFVELLETKREMIMAFAIPTKCSSNNLAEAYATMVGTAWCVSHGDTNFVLELDSLIMVNVLKERTTENCKLRTIIDDIIQILAQAEIEV